MKNNGWLDGTQMERHGTIEPGTVVRKPYSRVEDEEEVPKKEVASKPLEVLERK